MISFHWRLAFNSLRAQETELQWVCTPNSDSHTCIVHGDDLLCWELVHSLIGIIHTARDQAVVAGWDSEYSHSTHTLTQEVVWTTSKPREDAFASNTSKSPNLLETTSSCSMKQCVYKIVMPVHYSRTGLCDASNMHCIDEMCWVLTQSLNGISVCHRTPIRKQPVS